MIPLILGPADNGRMALHQQPDLFGDPQAELFEGEAAPVVYRPDPDRVRARLRRILGEARAASAMPWDRTQLGLYQTIVPQMTLSLPEDEAARWRLDFESEVARLEAAA
jgi:hypothetical protein